MGIASSSRWGGAPRNERRLKGVWGLSSYYYGGPLCNFDN